MRGILDCVYMVVCVMALSWVAASAVGQFGQTAADGMPMDVEDAIVRTEDGGFKPFR